MQKSLKDQIGVAVRHARTREHLTQEGLADAIGKTGEAVSNIERGLSLPSLETIIDIGRVLRIPVASLLGDMSPKSKKQPKRLALELKLQSAAEGLDDKLLEIAIKILSAISELKH